MAMREMDKLYNPQGLQEKWYARWESEGYFDFRRNTGKDESELSPENAYSIVIPPPNVTGSLHLGHALNHTLQDILIRVNRMRGKAALWVPGTDHAGIATQNVVERLLAKDGIRREDLGRAKFEERVWQWKAESGGMITHQQRQLGESVNWGMERFTMDEGLSHIVRRVFVQLYNEGLIYRGERMINWCPKDKTALSNIEVEHREVGGNLYYVRYPIEAAKHEGNDYVLVATTRPETILGDEALAVHPEDERYAGLKDARAKVPFIGKSIPIVFDDSVDKDFGTGVVKITPAHDFNDFATGTRHKLPFTNIMTDSAHMNSLAGPYEGLSREECRKKIVADLEAADKIEKIVQIKHSVGHSYRSGAIVEPRLSMQWFVKVRPLADKAVEAVQTGKTEFYPKRWENLFFDWMQKIEDWCISRQLWWGHQIPAWYCNACDAVNVSMHDADTCEKCGSTDLRRDSDVLDTWFSSALWPFSTLMPRDPTKVDAIWPEGAVPKSPMLENFYPTSALVTGFDIIFFWVSRMLMMGMHFMKAAPFEKVMIHSLVRDANRQKMSKSKGNVVNPLEKMEEYGTDAFRFFLVSIMPDGKDIVYDESRLKGYQGFCNKIYNTARYLLMNTPENFVMPESAPKLSAIDEYVIAEMNEAIKKCDAAIDGFHFADYALAIYDFLWKTYCDQYIEMSKVALKSDDLKDGTLYTLHRVFATALRLLHPVMPYITEELNSYLPGHETRKLMIVTQWPKAEDSHRAGNLTPAMLEIAAKVRQIRAELSVEPGARIAIYLDLEDEDLKQFVAGHVAFLQNLARLGEVVFARPEGKMVRSVTRQGSIYLDLSGSIDTEKEKGRLEKEIASIEKGRQASEAKLASPQFAERAPAELVEAEKMKLNDYNTRVDALREMLSSLT
jgi:valyl-tRNA synthetase